MSHLALHTREPSGVFRPYRYQLGELVSVEGVLARVVRRSRTSWRREPIYRLDGDGLRKRWFGEGAIDC